MGLVRDLDGVRPYDFQRPHQLSRAQLDAITSTVTLFWRGTANFLSTYLRTPVQLQQLTVHQVPYEDMIQSIKTPAVLGIVATESLAGTAMIECTPSIALAMIDRALGGPGVGVMASRRLSEIEQSIVRRIFERVLNIYGDVWQPITPVRAKLTSMEHNPAFAQIAGEGDLVLVARQQLLLDQNRGQMMMIWPYANIASLGEAAVKYQLMRDGSLENVQVKQEEMRRHVESAPVHGAVVLGRTELTLRDFEQLKVGDAVIMKNRYDQPLTLRMSNREKFLVLPGRVRGRLAVRVISRVEDE